MKKILEHPDYDFSVSATTRAPRPGEEDGREYFFRTKEQFRAAIAEDRLLEYAEYCGNYYGTPRAAVEEKLRRGVNVILEIEVQGAMQVRQRDPSALLIMIAPPDYPALEERAAGQGNRKRGNGKTAFGGGKGRAFPLAGV